MSVEETETIDFASNISAAEGTLLEKAAERAADEAFLGEPETATIEDVVTDDDALGENVVVKYVLSLPNEKTGSITFSEYDWEDGRVEAFLEQLHASVTDMDSAAYHTVPVTYTEMKGWIVFYGSHPNLETTYRGKSNVWTVGERSGFPKAKWPVKIFTRSPLIIGLVASLVSSSIGPMIMALFAWVFLGYCAVAWSGMSVPWRKQVEVE